MGGVPAEEAVAEVQTVPLRAVGAGLGGAVDPELVLTGFVAGRG
ncbi:hypothetical protein [Micromonospora sp. NPDC023814]